MDDKKKYGIEDNNKIVNPKSLIVSGDVHELVKNFCKKTGGTISFLAEKLFLEHIRKNDK